MKATLVPGGKFADERGILRFVNEPNPGHYRRFYLITHQTTSTVRAWQGHRLEEKAFYTITGSFLIAVVTPTDFDHPGDHETPAFFRMEAAGQQLLRVPGGSYTGIKALSPNSTLLVLSALDFAGSKADDYRQPSDRWVDWDTVTAE